MDDNTKMVDTADVKAYIKILMMDEAQKASMLKRFPKITKDTLFIWGERDPALEKALTFDTETLIEGHYSIKYIADAGHFVHIEQPDLVNNLILEFLSGTKL